MVTSSLVRYGSFSVEVNFRSIISDVSLGRISVHSVQLIQIRSLLSGPHRPQEFTFQTCVKDSLYLSICYLIIESKF